MVPWRVIFFAINCTACVGWIAITAQLIATDADWSVFTVTVGAVMASPAIAVAIAEWSLFTRRMPWLECPLGVLAGVVGLLALLALILNAAETAGKDESPSMSFWLGFGTGCVLISAYGFWCCWLRVRQQTIVAPRGFPVEGSGNGERKGDIADTAGEKRRELAGEVAGAGKGDSHR